MFIKYVVYFVAIAASGSHTTRKPMPRMSEYHQILFGCCGSVFNQASCLV